MVQLVPMKPTEFEAFSAQDILEYAQENIRAGYWTPEEAAEKSRAAHELLLPQGMDTPDHYFFTIRADEEQQAVGVVWLAIRRESAEPSGFIYDLSIGEPYRGKGIATQAMLALEEKAKALGLQALYLHVFAHNQTARALYDKLGYQVTSLNMVKKLTRQGRKSERMLPDGPTRC
jgi:RimJ/RimL family protein N-acetyltransferase